MKTDRRRLNIGVIVLSLLSLINLLTLISPRSDDDLKSISRLPIQLTTGLVLVLMLGTLVFVKKHLTPVNRYITFFIALLIIYTFVYLASQPFISAEYSQYIKTLVWTTAIIFFYEMFLLYGINNKAVRFYLVTSVIAIAKQILVESKFESATLAAGDTASLPLLYLIPTILMMFNKKNRIILIVVVYVLILLSLRRTTILGAVCCVPFLFKDLKRQLKPGVVVAAAVLFSIAIIVAWYYLGDAIVFRFTELQRGDSNGDVGSGRSQFYRIVWDSWFNGSGYSIIFGNGLTAVRHLLVREYNGLEHAHNDYLEIGYTFGLLGITVWFLFLNAFWRLRRKLKIYYKSNINMFYIAFFSYIIISLASGCILRVTTMPLSLALALFMYNIQLGKKQKNELKYMAIKNRERQKEEALLISA